MWLFRISHKQHHMQILRVTWQNNSSKVRCNVTKYVMTKTLEKYYNKR